MSVLISIKVYHHREIDKESARYSYFNLPFLDNHFDITMNINLSTRSRSNKVGNACYRIVLANISLIRVISIPFITVENSFPNFSRKRRHLCSPWFQKENLSNLIVFDLYIYRYNSRLFYFLIDINFFCKIFATACFVYIYYYLS